MLLALQGITKGTGLPHSSAWRAPRIMRACVRELPLTRSPVDWRAIEC
jgi:hypothetical protein